MTQTGKNLLMFGLMLAALPLMADPLDEESAAIEMVKVVTQAGRPGDCLAALAVNKIDGEMRVVPAQGFLIEPGVHTINGRATLDSRKCQPIAADQRIGNVADLEANFETGRTYYIAYDHKSQNTQEWRLVVWKVEIDNSLETFIQ
jgi:hypothetical protein